MSDVGLLALQIRSTNRAFWRNPASAFFTFAFPLMFLVIFTSLLGSGTVAFPNGITIEQDRYYVAAMTAFSVITATYTNLAMSITFTRDAGILKRTRGTPLPGWVYLVGRVAHAMLVSLLLVVIAASFGIVFYGAAVPTGAALAEFVLTISVGAMAFSALGLATTAIIPNADASPAMVNAIVLPLLFLSGIFIPITQAPQWMRVAADVFPVKHFAEATLASFYGAPLEFEWLDLLVVAAWGAAGLGLATRFFSWEPRK